jgi:type I restriction enzyme S subunit
MYEGSPPGVVASDLTIRLLPNNREATPFYTAYLSYLYLKGYWGKQAGGASDSMKKITRSQIAREIIPTPSLSEQSHIVKKITYQTEIVRQLYTTLEARLEAIDRLPAALLQQAFRGELTQRPGVSVGIQLAPDDVAMAVPAYIVHKLHKHQTFGRVKLEKMLYLTEGYAEIDMGGSYVRAAAGPLDMAFLNTLEERAQEADIFTKHPREQTKGYHYTPGTHMADALATVEHLPHEQRERLDYFLGLFAELKTNRVEVVATLYAAWNDFLLDGHTPSDEMIIQDIHENWPGKCEKPHFAPDKLHERLDWMREKGLVPRGQGPHTVRMGEGQP